MVKSNNLVKKTAVMAVTAGVAVGLTMGIAPVANAAGENVVFIQGVKGDGFYITMECGVKAAAKKLGVTTSTQGPAKFDATLQRPILASVVASKPDAILIAPNDVNAMQKPLEQAAKSGIKVVLVDTTVKDPSFAVSQIASNNLAGGAAAFAAVKKLVPDGGKVLGIGVKPGISTTDARDKGFQDAVAASGGKYVSVGQQYSNNEPAIAAQITTAALAKDPDLKAIFASNLFSAQGAATGIKQAGKEGQVVVIGFDAGPDQVKALKAGTVQALIAQQPYQIGVQGVNQAVNALRGLPTKKKITTGFSILTKSNIDTPAGKAAQYRSTC
ncbi:MAG: substrate-binding domain-containing protein [Actinobacteria bacterium]|jgi:ribose transport system substrate-binding protein|nr:substrate-binding domain-containing protein [Actinomycetota bacterium]